jgi:hypothetical protein
MHYKTIVVESSKGFFKSSYQKLAPLIDAACQQLASEGYEVFSISPIGIPAEPACIVTGVHRGSETAA